MVVGAGWTTGKGCSREVGEGQDGGPDRVTSSVGAGDRNSVTECGLDERHIRTRNGQFKNPPIGLADNDEEFWHRQNTKCLSALLHIPF